MLWEALLGFSFIYCFLLSSNKIFNFGPSLFQELWGEFGQEGQHRVTARGWGEKQKTEMYPHRGVFEYEWWPQVMTHRRGRTARFIKNNHLVWITGWTWTSQKFSSSTDLEKLIHSFSFPLFHYTIYFLSFTQPVELEKKVLLLHLDFTCRPAGGWTWDPTKVKVKREIFLWLGSASRSGKVGGGGVINSITAGGCFAQRDEMVDHFSGQFSPYPWFWFLLSELPFR